MATTLTLEELVAGSERLLGFTGAGVSTESGIPDFRSPGGVWTRFDPRNFEFARYVADPEVRALSWQMRREFVAARATPNAAHRFFAAAEESGRGLGVVTQNIYGLHQDAGSRTVVELHGTARRVMCIGRWPVDGQPDGCGWDAPYSWAFERLDAGDADPACPVCGGLVKSATVSFGQQLFPAAIEESLRLVQACDLMVVVGSSLQVYPAAALPQEAVRAGARLVLVNDEPTPYDGLADLVVRGRAAEVLAPLLP